MTQNVLFHADSRDLSFIKDGSVHLILTSPPYFNLKEYRRGDNQLGIINDYQQFVDELEKVWKECYRVLVPGGRIVCVVGDVCLSRRKYGRHVVMPLHSDIAVSCRRIGFDNLNPILWHKISNAAFEANTNSSILGKPYEPNAIIKNDMEYILMERKPGGYRKPTEQQREKSKIDKEDFQSWFTQIWEMPGASTRNGHPAPFPLELATRLVKMFSFVDDVVLDPFCGSGTTMLAAINEGRSAVGVEAEEYYCRYTLDRIEKEKTLFHIYDVHYYDISKEPDSYESRKKDVVNS
ncbi:DNA (cytosine-5-)-methyltransferase [Oribacterium sp. oral taxon 078 str. F0262]|uniref:DNA-methyltransferase n=1 Tax=Oribacterium sp. oral taxon 078 TaxID=652706 RepID=UPI0001BCBB43|nr:DNA methyltransferase [Oribacterium sp. oral taxon 078]EFE90455.1 DNA (cytosine-5-)-methyltransferase [Oribacterium sp. oral taxon 078 str. F0262]